MHRLRLALIALFLAACSGEAVPDEEGNFDPSQSTGGIDLETPIVTPAVAPTSSAVPEVRLESVASGFDLPSGIAVGPDGEIYVNETRSGLIRVVDADGTPWPETFLDLSDRIRGDGERGLLGFALHPDYASNRRIFVHYTRRSDGAIIVSEFAGAADGRSADPGSERILLTVDHPSAFHNGGQLAFGPERYLYVGLGDGGSLGDADGNAQNPAVLLGKILRIDVDGPAAPGRNYGIPPDNPFATGEGAPEVFVLGVRNPWRFSFDPATDALWVADVGEGATEEVNRIPSEVASGANLGWSVMEGSTCYNLLPCDPSPFVAPLAEYYRETGCAIIGGVVVRGEAAPSLDGWYLFADYCEGTIFGVPADALAPHGEPLSPRSLAETRLPLTAFGQGPEGQVFVADIIGGVVYRVIALGDA